MQSQETMYKFRTLGNAIIQILENDIPIISTDPWLVGRAYFDSWALHHPISEEEKQLVIESQYIWISHGHPDHLHWESLSLFPDNTNILLPDHYSDEIKNELISHNFNVEVLEYRKWKKLSNGVEVLCIDNINQDGILVIRAGDALLINFNDSPICGEEKFIKGLIKNHKNKEKIFAFQLCAVAADMINFVDENETRIIPPAAEYQPGVVGVVRRRMEQLEIPNFCCSSSQHIYVRKDTQWLNEYDMTYDVMRKHWNTDRVNLYPPFITFDLQKSTCTRNWPSLEMDRLQFLDNCGPDDWEESLQSDDWTKVEKFFKGFETLRHVIDFIEIKVAGEVRTFYTAPTDSIRSKSKMRGIRFIVPRYSLMETVKWGYFDDLLIGNFMKTQLINTTLYPDFSPRIAKYGGNAKVYTNQQLRRFYWHYVRRNPVGMVMYTLGNLWQKAILPRIRDFLEESPLRPTAKYLYRRIVLREKNYRM